MLAERERRLVHGVHRRLLVPEEVIAGVGDVLEGCLLRALALDPHRAVVSRKGHDGERGKRHAVHLDLEHLVHHCIHRDDVRSRGCVAADPVHVDPVSEQEVCGACGHRGGVRSGGRFCPCPLAHVVGKSWGGCGANYEIGLGTAHQYFARCERPACRGLRIGCAERQPSRGQNCAYGIACGVSVFADGVSWHEAPEADPGHARAALHEDG